MSICQALTGKEPLTEENTRDMNPVAMAFVGDSIFDLYLRSHLVIDTDLSPAKLHQSASAYANAEEQSKIVARINDMLTDTEQAVLRRGRNAKVHTIPKHASPQEYHRATGFEALLGYLFLTGQDERLCEILKLSVPEIGQREI